MQIFLFFSDWGTQLFQECCFVCCDSGVCWVIFGSQVEQLQEITSILVPLRFCNGCACDVILCFAHTRSRSISIICPLFLSMRNLFCISLLSSFIASLWRVTLLVTPLSSLAGFMLATSFGLQKKGSLEMLCSSHGNLRYDFPLRYQISSFLFLLNMTVGKIVGLAAWQAHLLMTGLGVRQCGSGCCSTLRHTISTLPLLP